MRFRSNIKDIKGFHDVCRCLNKTHKKVIFKLMKEEVVMFAVKEKNEMDIRVFLNPVEVFTDFKIESNMNDTIGLKINLDMLTQATKICVEGQSQLPAVKLAKFGSKPCLQFRVMVENVKSDQNVPCEIIHVNDLPEEPDYETPDVVCELPSVKKLKAVVDRLAMVSTTMTLLVNTSRELHVNCKTQILEATSKFSNISYHNGDPQQEYEVKIKTKGIQNVLNIQVIDPTGLICGILENEAVIFIARTPANAIAVEYYLNSAS